MSTAFDLLREAREQRHLSLSDVADATLINIDYLRAIEQGRLDVLPPPYVRAFMREYAAVVGLDPAVLMQKLDREQGAAGAPGPEQAPPAGPPQTPSRSGSLGGPESSASTREERSPLGSARGDLSAPESGAPESPAPRLEPQEAAPGGGAGAGEVPPPAATGGSAPVEAAPRDLSRYASAAVVIVALAVAGIVLWNILGRKEQVTPERPFHEVVKENERLAAPESAAAQQPAARDTAAKPGLKDSLTLVAQASDSVWVRMMLDDGLIRDYFFRPGDTMSWRAREQFLFFTIGNPGAFALKLNGQALTLPGPPGRPLQHLEIRSTGIVTPGPSH